MKKLVLLLTFIVIAFVSFGQSPPPAVGNYRSFVGGIWSVNGTWEMGNGAAWVAATSYPGQNPNTGVVFIQVSHDITLTATVPNSIDSIRIGVSGTNGTLTFFGTPAITLTVEGDFKNIDGNVMVVNASGPNFHTLNIGGNLSMPGADDVFNMIAAGFDDRCNVVFNGTNQTITNPGNSVFTFQNITFSNTGTVTIANNINDIQGTMTVNANSIISPAATAILDDNGGTITGTGTINVTRITGTPDYASQYNFNTDNLSTLTVDYSGAGAQTINGLTYGTLKTSGSGIKSLAAPASVNDNITVGASTTFFLPAIDISIASATVMVNGTIDFSQTDGSILNTSGASSLSMGGSGLIRTRNANGLGPATAASLENISGTFTADVSSNGTVEYYRDASPNPITDIDYNNLLITGTGTKTWTLSANRTVNGNFTIAANTPFTFAGGQTLNLKGNWTKNSTATFTPGTTTVNFNGTAAQSITGAASTSTTFTGLAINNAAGVTLGQDVNVNGVLTFTNGRITSTAANILTINSTGSVTGQSSSSYVNGHLAKFGSSDFTFPVGNATLYRPISISSITGGAANVVALYTQANPKTAFGTALGAGIDHIGVCEYWGLDDGTANISGIVKLEFGGSCNGNPYIDDPASLLVAHWNGTIWENKGNDGTATLNSVKANIPSTFSPFTIGSSSAQNPLPVKLSTIKAYEKQSGIQIDWTVLTELNLSKYQVERSADGVTFTAIGDVTALNSFTLSNYGFFDANPLRGISFYRLKSIDIDGKIYYSSIMKVNLDKNVKGISLYPNPVTGGSVSFQSSDLARGNYSVKVFAVSGQQVYSQRFTHNGGAINQTIQLPGGIKSGMYSMQLDNEGEKVMTKTFMVQ